MLAGRIDVLQQSERRVGGEWMFLSAVAITTRRQEELHWVR